MCACPVLRQDGTYHMGQRFIQGRCEFAKPLDASAVTQRLWATAHAGDELQLILAEQLPASLCMHTWHSEPGLQPRHWLHACL